MANSVISGLFAAYLKRIKQNPKLEQMSVEAFVSLPLHERCRLAGVFVALRFGVNLCCKPFLDYRPDVLIELPKLPMSFVVKDVDSIFLQGNDGEFYELFPFEYTLSYEEEKRPVTA